MPKDRASIDLSATAVGGALLAGAGLGLLLGPIGALTGLLVGGAVGEIADRRVAARRLAAVVREEEKRVMGHDAVVRILEAMRARAPEWAPLDQIAAETFLDSGTVTHTVVVLVKRHVLETRWRPADESLGIIVEARERYDGPASEGGPETATIGPGDLGGGKRLTRDLVVLVERDGDQVVVTTPYYRLYGYGPTLEDALGDLRSVLVDVYELLDDDGAALSPYLTEQWRYLQSMIVPIEQESA